MCVTHVLRYCESTIYGQVAKSSGGGSLDFDVGAVEEEEDGLEGGAVYGSDVYRVWLVEAQHAVSCIAYLSRLSRQMSDWRFVAGRCSGCRRGC